MKKKIMNKLEKALKKISEANELLCEANDEIFYEPSEMLTKNMTVQDTISFLYGQTNDLKADINSTINAIKQ